MIFTSNLLNEKLKRKWNDNLIKGKMISQRTYVVLKLNFYEL